MFASTISIPDECGNTIFGIDFGTIRARAVTIRNPSDDLRETELIQDIPSVVSFTTNPQKCLVGSEAKIRIVSGASNTFHVTKYLLGRSYDDPIVQKVIEKNFGYEIYKSPDGHACLVSSNYQQILTPTQIAALIFMKLKELAEKEFNVPMKNVIITIPIYFTEDQVQATREAAQMAGLNVLKLMNEHISAVFSYTPDETKNKFLIVYDFGGTFKVSVLEIRNGEPEMKSTVVDLFLSGDDFDYAVVNYLIFQLIAMTGVNLTESSISMQWLKKSAECAKIDLSYCTEVNIKFYCVCLEGPPQLIIVKLTRTKFEELIVDYINKTIPLCHKVLEDAKIRTTDIDEVFAIGGISIIPKVKSTVEEIFGKKPSNYDNCCRKEAVAFGAALEGYKLRANTFSDNLAPPLKVHPHLPKPTAVTEMLSYCLSDNGDDDKIGADVAEGIFQTGVIGILTEEEADSRVIQDNVTKNFAEYSDVNYIPAFQQILQTRRSHPELEIPDDLQALIDNFRKRRDDFVIKELRRIFTMKM